MSTCTRVFRFMSGRLRTALLIMAGMAAGESPASLAYQVYVSNERSGDLTVIDGSNFKVVATIPVGKRPRGIHASPDGTAIYVALSGTPVPDPPKLDAQGNPIFKNGDDDDANIDKKADGIGVVDVAQRKLIRRITAGADPEEFSFSKDGTALYVPNEDVKAASVVNIASGKVAQIIAVGQEPEGVGTTPDGRYLYLTCEAGGDVMVVDTVSAKTIAHFMVKVRPRSVDFLPGAGIGFIPSESVGLLNVIDTLNHKLLQSIVLPAGSRPMKVRVSPNGQRVYTSNGRAGTITVLDSHSYQVLDTIKVGARPWGIAISPDGKYLYAANGPSNDVSVVDLMTDKEITRIKAGTGPWGIAITAATP
jgi:YVTN family beta-propeller protein